MNFLSCLKDPFGKAILISLSLHVVLFATISCLNPVDNAAILPEIQKVKVHFLSVEKQVIEEWSPVVAEAEPILPEAEPALPGIIPEPPIEFVMEAAPDNVPEVQVTAPQPVVETILENSPSSEMAGSIPGEPLIDDLNLEGARMPAPVYPTMAKQMGWEGEVSIIFTINSKGRVEEIVIDQSSGFELLDQSVITTVRKYWRFPRGGDSLRVRKEFSFRLI